VINLAGGLVVPGTPGLAAIHADRGSLITAQNHAIGVSGIDPEDVVVVSAGRPFVGDEGLASIRRPIKRGLGDVNDVRVVRIEKDFAEITATLNTWITGDLLPTRSAIVGAVESGLLASRDDCIYACAAWSERDSDASHSFSRQTGFANRLPGFAAIDCLPDRAPAIPVDLGASVSRLSVVGPQRRKAGSADSSDRK
jgi:hypothetical protein